jgi:hypothetical protein
MTTQNHQNVNVMLGLSLMQLGQDYQTLTTGVTRHGNGLDQFEMDAISTRLVGARNAIQHSPHCAQNVRALRTVAQLVEDEHYHVKTSFGFVDFDAERVARGFGTVA